MSEKRYVARSSAIAARVLGDETMIMSAADSTLITLNDVATVIWESADGATPLDEIVAKRICTQYDVLPEVALKDAEELAEMLASRGLVKISNQPIVKAASPPKEPR